MSTALTAHRSSSPVPLCRSQRHGGGGRWHGSPRATTWWPHDAPSWRGDWIIIAVKHIAKVCSPVWQFGRDEQPCTNLLPSKLCCWTSYVEPSSESLFQTTSKSLQQWPPCFWKPIMLLVVGHDVVVHRLGQQRRRPHNAPLGEVTELLWQTILLKCVFQSRNNYHLTVWTRKPYTNLLPIWYPS